MWFTSTQNCNRAMKNLKKVGYRQRLQRKLDHETLLKHEKVSCCVGSEPLSYKRKSASKCARIPWGHGASAELLLRSFKIQQKYILKSLCSNAYQRALQHHREISSIKLLGFKWKDGENRALIVYSSGTAFSFLHFHMTSLVPLRQCKLFVSTIKEEIEMTSKSSLWEMKLLLSACSYVKGQNVRSLVKLSSSLTGSWQVYFQGWRTLQTPLITHQRKRMRSFWRHQELQQFISFVAVFSRISS